MGRGRTSATVQLIDTMYEILEEIQPTTVRSVCYQLFVRALIPSMAKKHTDAVSAKLTRAREDELIPWEWVVDDGRKPARAATWKDPESFIPVVMAAYRVDRWERQAVRVEVWSEKGTVSGMLGPILQAYGVTFRVMKGHGSATAVHNVALESQESDRPFIALYLGDYDPSGYHMSATDLPDRLERYGGAIALQRIAITAERARAENLPSFSAETKKLDPRYRWFTANYGHTCWELDAMNPVILRSLVEDAICSYIDWPLWDRCAAVEEAEQRSLKTILGNWPKAIARLARK